MSALSNGRRMAQTQPAPPHVNLAEKALADLCVHLRKLPEDTRTTICKRLLEYLKEVT